jgi:Ca2+-binding RTX toxin-like protein
MRTASIDRLESRQLFAVTLDNGTLNVIGTSNNDHVHIYVDAGKSPKPLHVKLNHRSWRFALAEVELLRIRTDRGDDHVKVSGKNFALRTYIHAESGNDVVAIANRDFAAIFLGKGHDLFDGRSSSGGLRVHGDHGNDTVTGSSSYDFITGGDGNDVLSGFSGHDTLYGGKGDDVLHGNSGNDVLFGDAGQDRLDGGAGDDSHRGGQDRDRLFGDDAKKLLDDSSE